MIIDLILDRKDGKNIKIKDGKLYTTQKYNPKDFYDWVMGYGETGHDIAESLDNGQEDDVKRELCRYIIENEYNPDVCNFINSVNWL